MKPIVNKKIQLQRHCGKGGWTYASVEEIRQNPDNPFGWVTVRGSIDEYQFKQLKLMPMGNGSLFLPIKAAIRKKINKQAGDIVHIVLFLDDSLVEVPKDILACFQEEPKQILKTFLSFTQGEQKNLLDWIASAKTDQTKVKRIAKMIEQIGFPKS